MTHTDIKGLGYVKISTNDMARWRTFAFDVLGFAKGSGPDENAPLPTTRRACCSHRRRRG